MGNLMKIHITDSSRLVPEMWPTEWQTESDPKELEALLNDEGFAYVGKVRPWDETDNEHIVYHDGDLILIRGTVVPDED